MSSLPPSSKYRQRASETVDDVERESLTQRLSDAYADGRMTQDDYMAALDTVYSARTLGDLVGVAERLPAPAVDVPAIVGSGSVPAGQTAQGRNVLVPAMVVAGSVLALLLVLAVVLGLFIL